MADVDLNLLTVNKGALERRFQGALKTVAATMGDKELVGKTRTITLTIKMTPDDDEFVKVETGCQLKLPVTTDVGTGWVQNTESDEASFGTKEYGVDPRQEEMPGIERVTPIRRGKD